MRSLLPYFLIMLISLCICYGMVPTINDIERTFGKPAILIRQTATPPVIDGDLSDAAWEISQPYQLDHIDGCASPLQASTTVRLLCDNSNLYVSWLCMEPRMDLSIIDTSSYGMDGDIVVLYLDPHHAHYTTLKDSNNIRIRINMQGKVNISRSYPGSGSVSARVHAGNDQWIVELSFPLSKMGFTASTIPTVIGLNAVRIRPQSGGPYATVAVTGSTRELIDHNNFRYGENTSLAPFWVDYKVAMPSRDTGYPLGVWGPLNEVFLPWRFAHAILEVATIVKEPPDSPFEIIAKEHFINGAPSFSNGTIVEESFLGIGKAYRTSGTGISYSIALHDPRDVTAVATVTVDSGRLAFYPHAADNFCPSVQECWGEYTSCVGDGIESYDTYTYDTHSDKMGIYTAGRFGRKERGWQQATFYYGESTGGSMKSPSSGWNICRLRMELMDGGPAAQHLMWHWFDPTSHIDIQIMNIAGQNVTVGDLIVYRGIDAEAPTPVTQLNKSMDGNDIVFSWPPSEDNVLTVAYEVVTIDQATETIEHLAFVHDLTVRIPQQQVQDKIVRVRAWDLDGNASTVSLDSVGIDKELKNKIENRPELSVAPNPFNPGTVMTIGATRNDESAIAAKVAIYDMKGTCVKSVSLRLHASAPFHYTWNAIHQASGIYIVKATIGDKVLTRRITLLK